MKIMWYLGVACYIIALSVSFYQYHFVENVQEATFHLIAAVAIFQSLNAIEKSLAKTKAKESKRDCIKSVHEITVE